MNEQNIGDRNTFISNDRPCANDSCREMCEDRVGFVDIASMSEEELHKRLPEFLNDFAYANSCNYCDGFHQGSPFVRRALQLE
jgi:hypothetical protein